MTIPRKLSILAEGASSSGVLGVAYHYERMVPLLIEAIKELSAKVKELESKQCP